MHIWFLSIQYCESSSLFLIFFMCLDFVLIKTISEMKHEDRKTNLQIISSQILALYERGNHLYFIKNK